MKKSGNCATWISAASALLALIFTIIVWYQTRRLLQPFERPIISMVEINSVTIPMNNPPQVKTKIKYRINNIGKHPAFKLRIRLGGALDSNKPLDFKVYNDLTSANRIDPDGFFNFEDTVVQAADIKNGKHLTKSAKAYLHLLLSYKDFYDPTKEYYDEFWLTYRSGKGAPSTSSEQEKIALLPYVKENYGKEYETIELN